MPRVQPPAVTPKRKTWNREQNIGQKRLLKPKQVWAIRARFEPANNLRDLALLYVAIDGTLRGGDLVSFSAVDPVTKGLVRELVSVIQSIAKWLVQFELTENTRDTVLASVNSPEISACSFIFPGHQPKFVKHTDGLPISSCSNTDGGAKLGVHCPVAGPLVMCGFTSISNNRASTQTC